MCKHTNPDCRWHPCSLASVEAKRRSESGRLVDGVFFSLVYRQEWVRTKDQMMGTDIVETNNMYVCNCIYNIVETKNWYIIGTKDQMMRIIINNGISKIIILPI